MCPTCETARVPWTYQLPCELREELEAVARYNELNRAGIAVEAIERHSRHFRDPPDRQKPVEGG